MNHELRTVIGELAALRDQVNRESNSLQNIALSLNPDSVVVEGNQAGLIELARQILAVALRQIDGAHQDFDKAGFASHVDRPLVVALNSKL